MLVCINCSNDTKMKMDYLLAKDCYRDYSELVAVAVENLWMLDREVDEKGALVIGDSAIPLVTSLASPPLGRARSVSGAKTAPPPPRQSKPAGAPPTPAAPSQVQIPEMFKFEGMDRLTSATLEFPPIENTYETFTLDRWIFGQYNKLLPAKVNCRALLRLAAGPENGGSLDTAAAQIAEVAALLGDYLSDHDHRHQIGRDDALATAFPRSGPDAEKSRARYANQFVGSANSQGVPSGLLWDYRLAGLASGNGPRLLPTEQAIRFARLANPILDGCQTVPAQKFSSEETAFLLDHIRSFVPAEQFAFGTLIQAITDGADTPDKLDEALRAFVPADTNRSLSQSFLTSQRSGALSRMADLGLIERVRRGVKVSYIIAQHGEAFIGSAGNTTEKENGSL
jgi:hypothetical protein